MIYVAIGVALLVSASVLVWRRPAENNPVTAMFLAGLALLLISDQGIRNFKLSATGVEVTREDLNKATVDYTDKFAKLNAAIEEQKRINIAQTAILTTPDPEAGKVGADAPPSDGARKATRTNVTKIQDIQQTFAANAQYSILVFYRDGVRQKAAAEAMSSALVKQGYQSSATNTDLTEVVPELSADRKPGTVVLAAKSLALPILNEVQSIAQKAASDNRLHPPVLNDNEWPLRRGNVQIYIF